MMLNLIIPSYPSLYCAEAGSETNSNDSIHTVFDTFPILMACNLELKWSFGGLCHLLTTTFLPVGSIHSCKTNKKYNSKENLSMNN